MTVHDHGQKIEAHEPLIKLDLVLIGGDLNFILGANEIWGSVPHLDPPSVLHYTLPRGSKAL
jgi:hypothetical protein